MKILTCLCAILVAAGACTKGATSTEASKERPSLTESISSEPTQSSAKRRAAKVGSGDIRQLEGEWRVLKGDVEMFVFKFHGSNASVRYPSKGNEEVSGSMALFANNGFVITPEDGRRHIFRYAVDGDQVFIGRGESHLIDDETKFTFKVTSKHRVVFDGTTCTLKNGDKVLQTIECSYDRDANPPKFSYDSPIPAMPGPKRPRLLYLVGKTLISDTLYAYKAARVE